MLGFFITLVELYCKFFLCLLSFAKCHAYLWYHIEEIEENLFCISWDGSVIKKSWVLIWEILFSNFSSWNGLLNCIHHSEKHSVVLLFIHVFPVLFHALMACNNINSFLCGDFFPSLVICQWLSSIHIFL